MKPSSGRLSIKICFGICVSLVMVCAAFGVYTRLSYAKYSTSWDKSGETPPYSISSGTKSQWDRDIEGYDFESLIRKAKESSLIIKGRLHGEKEIGDKGILASIEILEIYKGNNLAQGDTITLVEPYKIDRLSSAGEAAIRKYSPEKYQKLLAMDSASRSGRLYITESTGFPYVEGVVPISGSHEYLLFLNPTDRHLTRKSDLGAFVYPSTPFACISLSDKQTMQVSESGHLIEGSDLRDVSFIASDEESLNEFKRIASDLKNYAESLKG